MSKKHYGNKIKTHSKGKTITKLDVEIPTIRQEPITVFRMEHRESRKGVQTQLSARYDHSRLGWTLTKNPSIEDVCNKFSRGMLVACKSLYDLQDWYPCCVYMRELMDKHDFVVGQYIVSVYHMAGNQLCFHPDHAQHVGDFDFKGYIDAFDIEMDRSERIERRKARSLKYE